MSFKPPDRRRQERTEVLELLEATAISGSDVYTCQILDLSISGARLKFPEGFVGNIFEITFVIPNCIVVVPAIIRWYSSVSPNIVGMQYMQGLTAQETYMILEYLKEQKRNLYK